MKLFKLTDANGRTKNDTQWGDGKSHKTIGPGISLCTKDVIHAYRDPLLAVLMNPIHGQFSDPQLWEAEGDVVTDDGTKVGCKLLTTLRQIDLPDVTTEQRVRFAILVAKEVYTDVEFVKWADLWLSGDDRSKSAAESAARAAWAAWAARAARAAAESAESAAWAAWAESAARAAARAAAESAARAAARAAAWAAESACAELLDLIAIAHKAMEIPC